MSVRNYIESGLEFLIGTSLINKYSSRRNILVVVHQEQIKSNKVRDNLKRELKIFGENNTYYSNLDPSTCPIENDPMEKLSREKKEQFPPPEKIGTVYIAGCYKLVCVSMQVNWLRDNGYSSIVLIHNAVQ